MVWEFKRYSIFAAGINGLETVSMRLKTMSFYTQDFKYLRKESQLREEKVLALLLIQRLHRLGEMAMSSRKP